MSDVLLVNYNSIVKSKNWSVPWIFHNSKKENHTDRGILLQELVNINPLPFNRDDYDQNKQMKYIDRDCLSEKDGIHSVKMKSLKSLPKRARYIIKEGDLIFSLIHPNTSGIYYVSSEFDSSVINNTFAVLRPKSKKLTSFIFFIMQHSEVINELLSLTSGNNVPTISLLSLRNYQLPVTSAIYKDSKILLKADNLFNKVNSISKGAVNLICIVDEVFNEDTNYIETTQPQTTNSLNYYSLNELTISIKARKSSLAERVEPNHIPHDSIYIGKEDSNNNDFSDGTLLMTRIGDITKSAITSLPAIKLNVHQVITIEVKKNVSLKYIAYYLKTTKARNELHNLASQSTNTMYMKISNLKQLPIPIPSLSIQEKIVKQIESKLLITENRIKEVRDFITSLINL